MCLDTLRSDFVIPADVTLTAWKVFEELGVTLHSLFQDGLSVRPENTWITAIAGLTETSHKEPYTTGFHCFLTKKDAEAFVRHISHIQQAVIRPVLVRGPFTVGTEWWGDNTFTVLVANQLLIARPLRKGTHL